jgi:hypothetical protein
MTGGHFRLLYVVTPATVDRRVIHRRSVGRSASGVTSSSPSDKSPSLYNPISLCIFFFIPLPNLVTYFFKICTLAWQRGFGLGSVMVRSVWLEPVFLIWKFWHTKLLRRHMAYSYQACVAVIYPPLLSSYTRCNGPRQKCRRRFGKPSIRVERDASTVIFNRFPLRVCPSCRLECWHIRSTTLKKNSLYTDSS